MTGSYNILSFNPAIKGTKSEDPVLVKDDAAEITVFVRDGLTKPLKLTAASIRDRPAFLVYNPCKKIRVKVIR